MEQLFRKKKKNQYYRVLQCDYLDLEDNDVIKKMDLKQLKDWVRMKKKNMFSLWM